MDPTEMAATPTLEIREGNLLDSPVFDWAYWATMSILGWIIGWTLGSL